MNKNRYILEQLSKDDGFIYVKEAEQHGIDRFKLSYLANENKIDRIAHGIYALKDEFIDEYVLLQKTSDRVVYSYHTALYFHDLSDRVPSHIHITVPQGYNASRLKKRHENLKVHYVKKDVLNLGKVKGRSPFGGEIILYNIERTICDVVKNKDKIDSQTFTHAIKQYFSNKQINVRELIKYADILNVENEIRQYLEVLQ
ncbi:transcriptional regulator [Nosocomiicoccus sp. HMSC067E10]|uniref:type IV toxin-antitoxin system AbiEi family antitoxin domain-containing protein n=1 Tax=Nosocomiicoccus sp. HMSC067E10 TaxID=1739271 RepID=UPI0008A14F59|nr:type IV toxin-antitoxin system AbiEi family antitoxin domain-containing protein [Nosocomiicoccus sp. HMSC067E10]OFL48875.1 transcriptional regulator [Nosocomiicoccus sp. HMSC067E10]